MKIKFTLYTNRVGSEYSITKDIPDDEWFEMTPEEHEGFVTELFMDNVMFQIGGWDWSEEE